MGRERRIAQILDAAEARRKLLSLKLSAGLAVAFVVGTVIGAVFGVTITVLVWFYIDSNMQEDLASWLSGIAPAAGSTPPPGKEPLSLLPGATGRK